MMKRIMVAMLFFLAINVGQFSEMAYGQSVPLQHPYERVCTSSNGARFVSVGSPNPPEGFTRAAIIQNTFIPSRCTVGPSGNSDYWVKSLGSNLYALWMRTGDVEFCDTVPDSYKTSLGCSSSTPPPEQACANMKSYFDPPPESCEFEVSYHTVCRDGNGDMVSMSYSLRAADGRVSGTIVENADNSGQGGVAECQNYYSVCDKADGCWEPLNPEGEISDGAPPMPSEDCQKQITINGNETAIADICGKDGTPIDTEYGDGNDWYERCVYTDENGVIRHKDECKTPEEKEPDDTYFEDCIYQDENGVWKERENCKSEGGGNDGGGGGNGGGTPGGGGDSGGGGNGGGGTGGGGDGGGTPGGGGDSGGGGNGGGGTGGGGTPGGGGDTPGGTGGGGGGTGGGESGTGDGDEDLGSHSGDGGWGEIDGRPSMDKGKGDLKNELDGLFEKIKNSEAVQSIQNHKYISTVAPVCYMNIPLPMYNRTIAFSLCEYEGALRLLGNILLGMITISGFLMVMRS